MKTCQTRYLVEGQRDGYLQSFVEDGSTYAAIAGHDAEDGEESNTRAPSKSSETKADTERAENVDGDQIPAWKVSRVTHRGKTRTYKRPSQQCGRPCLTFSTLDQRSAFSSRGWRN